MQRLGAHGSFHPSVHASADVIRLFGYNAAGQIGSILRDNDAYAWTGAYNAARPYAANGLTNMHRWLPRLLTAEHGIAEIGSLG